MPVEHSFDTDANLLIVVLRGPVGDEDLLKYAHHITEDPSISAGHDELIDLREVETGGEVTSPVLRRIASMFSEIDRTPEQTRVAMVANSDVSYGLSRMYQAFRSESPLDLRVFREMSEARIWLGLSPE
jgi:hypothetical protein